MRCYRKILHVSFKDHVTNQEVCHKIKAAIGPYEDLLTTVKKRKLQWYGHVTRSTGLSKTILQGTLEGSRKRGGQRKRWEDNIKEWTGLTFARSQREAENRSQWRDIVRSSSVVSRRPGGYGTWWWWWFGNKFLSLLTLARTLWAQWNAMFYYVLLFGDYLQPW